MAGLTVLLQRHLQRPALSRLVVTEAVDAFEAVGPWFLTLFTLAVMGLTVHWTTDQPPIRFYLIITYASAVSLIISSPLHTLLNRYLADELFRGRYRTIVNNLTGLSIVMAAVSAAAALPLALVSTMALDLKIAFISLTMLMSLLWCVSAVMCALRKERLLLGAYALGMSLAVALFVIGGFHETQTMLLTFSLGLAVPTAYGFAFVLKVFLREAVGVQWRFFRRQHAGKVGLSIFVFNLGFWCDKFIFWFDRRSGQPLDPLFHYCIDYDLPFFIALSTMMLGAVMVYRGIKRKIIGPYEAFLFKLTHNFPFRELALEKLRLFQGISQVSKAILAFYGTMALVVMFLVYMGVIALPWRNPFVFHYLLVGTVFFALYLFHFLILQYLDEFTALLRLNLLFALTNAGFTAWSVNAGMRYYGAGFMAAAMLCAVASHTMVIFRVGSIEYNVFRNALDQASREKRQGAAAQAQPAAGRRHA